MVELRAAVVRGLLGVGVGACVTLPFGREIVGWLCVPLLEAQAGVGVAPGAYVFSPLSGFAVYLRVSLVGALVLSLPWVVHQGWRFLRAGLYEHERRVLRLLGPLSAGLSVLGVLFLYYVMLPVVLWFLIGFAVSYPGVGGGAGGTGVGGSGGEAVVGGAGGGVVRVPVVEGGVVAGGEGGEGAVWFDRGAGVLKVWVDGGVRVFEPAGGGVARPLIDLNQYLNFAAVLGLGVLVAFQLPVVMLMLGRAGVVDQGVLSGYRKHALFVCFAAGALLTPADVMSMVVLAGPLYLLFELGLLLMGPGGGVSGGGGGSG